MKRKIKLLFATLMIALLSSCGSGEEQELKPQLSAEKIITSFVISNLDPAVTATIDHTNHTIKLNVGNGVDLSNLMPTISVSEKATVSPASGVKLNLWDNALYKVTAEDGTWAVYSVSAIVSQSVSFTVKPLSSRNIQQDDFLVLEGTNFINSPNSKVVFESVGGGRYSFERPVEYLSSTSIRVKIPEDAEATAYNIYVYNSQEKLQLKDFDYYFITWHDHVINSVSKLTTTFGEQIVVTGNYFKNIDYNVYLVYGDLKTRVELDNYTKTSLTFKAPIIPYRSYQLYVGNAIHTEWIKVVPRADAPTITSVNKTTFASGETLVITGTNFKQDGLPTYVVLSTGTTAYTGVPTTINADGTQITYKVFSAGTYQLSVERGVYGGTNDYTYSFSDYYKFPITVNP